MPCHRNFETNSTPYQTKKVEWKYSHNRLETVNPEACKDQCQAPENKCMLNGEVRSEDTEIVSQVVDTCNVGVEDHPSTVESSSTQCDYVFSVTVIDNVRIPSLSELEISAQVRGHTANTNSCMLEGNMKNSDVMVARAVIAPGSTVPVRLLNPTGEPVNLYSGSKIALLSEVLEVTDSHLERETENMTAVSNVCGSSMSSLLHC